MKNQRGMTITELMIAIALIGIGVLAGVAAFNGIHKSIQSSKNRTLATNIAQEKMQIITQKTYYEVLVTTAPVTRTDVTPNITYDPNYFLPETLTEGGVNFTRYTNVQVAQEVDGAISILDPMTPDTGMRQITVAVVWAGAAGNQSLSIQYILNNPDTAMASTWLTGTVTNAATGATITGALVDAAENIGWRDSTDGTGKYKINLVPGTFNFLASASGYFTKTINQSVAFNSTTPLNFALTAIASGTVYGTVWIDDHVVISQVVSSTGPANRWEYVNLYNPTSSDVTMGDNTNPSRPSVWPVVFDASGNSLGRQLVYISNSIPAHGNYLITNSGDGNGSSAAVSCSTISISGVNVRPDACWRYVGTSQFPNNHTLQCGSLSSGESSNCAASINAGGFGIGTNGGLSWTSIGNVTKIDAIGWAGFGTTPNSYETSPAVASSSGGMVPGETFVRRLDTTTATSTTLGNSYDTNNNATDFIDYATVPPFVPRSTSTLLSPKTGTPATGARVSATDGLSATSTATAAGNPPYAQFILPAVATGTWIVFIDSGNYSAEIDTVAVVANSTTSVPNAATTPLWPAAGAYATVLSSYGTVGIISGKVTNVFLVPITGGITVTCGGATTTTGTNGTYALRVASGTYNVVANPGNANVSYEMDTKNNITVTLGDATQNVNFQLAQGGTVSGFISRDGTNPLPGVAVVAYDIYGQAHDTEASGNNGKFKLINLTTGTYTIAASLDNKEVSSPATASAVVVSGTDVSIGTFTITGAMGQVQGSVTAAGKPIKSGVLVVVSTQAISATPPALSSNTLTSSAYYADSSNETGTYSVDVRGSTTSVYNVKAFYMQTSGTSVNISTATQSNVTVTAGQATTGVNFAW